MWWLMPCLETKLLGFEFIKDLYTTDPDFKEVFRKCSKAAHGKYYQNSGFLFFDNCLCVPQCSLRELFLREAHGGGPMGHFGIKKTHKVVYEHIFWPSLMKDVERICGRYVVCKIAKSKAKNQVSTYGKRKADTIQKLHERVHDNIKAKTKVYTRKANKKKKKVVFKEGDLVWVHLRKERFPEERKSKLMPMVDGPFQILRKIHDNAYQLDLQGKYDIYSSFNVLIYLLFVQMIQICGHGSVHGTRTGCRSGRSDCLN